MLYIKIENMALSKFKIERVKSIRKLIINKAFETKKKIHLVRPSKLQPIVHKIKTKIKR